MNDRNSMGFWFPLIDEAGLPVPHTVLVHTEHDLTCLLDGTLPEGWGQLTDQLRDAGEQVGWPCFLRTGHGSGKHQWRETCHVPSATDMERHVAELVEWSAMADMMGLPTNVWAVRELLPTKPLFRCLDYGNFPVVREFRLFARDDVVEHIQPYWPEDAIEQGRPDAPWREALHHAGQLQEGEVGVLHTLATQAVLAVGGGYWSVDLLQDRDGGWWLTDMAEGDASFRYEP